MKPQPRGQSSPVCSVRRQLPGRRTSVFRPTDRGCEREPRQVRALPRGTPGWQVSGLPRIEWIGVSPDDVSEDPTRRGCCARNIAPEGRDRVAVGFSQLKLSSSTTGNHCLHRILSGDRNYSDDRSCLIAEVDFVPQRSPTVRRVTHLGNCEQKTKTKGNFPCAFTDFSKSAPLLAIPMVGLLKLSATRQENASGCNGNGAAAAAHPKRVFVACCRAHSN